MLVFIQVSIPVSILFNQLFPFQRTGFPKLFGGFLENMSPGKNGEATPRVFRNNMHQNVIFGKGLEHTL